ncbi:hypothetical protein [Qipengyuania sp. MTN3-11]|uniref:hypothetical protein n=1 Tax=Qipengyuania sp. MTN3-11 TaxID=3056557 RepID=UPI0036F19BF9
MIGRLHLVIPLLLLAGCQDEAPVPTEADTGREAAGEVLGGTISDDMLPLDRLRSQSPPLRVTESADGAASGPVEEPEPATATDESAEPAPVQDDAAPEPDAQDE